MGAGTFQRFEIKYLLNKEQREAIYEAMKPYMKADSYGNSTIRNIYFDRPDFLLIRNSLDKPIYKEKLRVRSYKKVSEEDKVFIELKKKFDGIVYKRRIGVKEKEAMNYLCYGKKLRKESQIGKEIDYFLDFYKEIEPKVFLSYDRQAFFDKENPDFRMTFDENILWREDNLSLTGEVYGKPILNDGEALLEIKSADTFPLWLVEVLSKYRIYKVSFSKYGNAYTEILKNKRWLFTRIPVFTKEENLKERLEYGYI